MDRSQYWTDREERRGEERREEGKGKRKAKAKGKEGSDNRTKLKVVTIKRRIVNYFWLVDPTSEKRAQVKDVTKVVSQKKKYKKKIQYFIQVKKSVKKWKGTRLQNPILYPSLEKKTENE